MERILCIVLQRISYRQLHLLSYIGLIGLYFGTRESIA